MVLQRAQLLVVDTVHTNVNMKYYPCFILSTSRRERKKRLKTAQTEFITTLQQTIKITGAKLSGFYTKIKLYITIELNDQMVQLVVKICNLTSYNGYTSPECFLHGRSLCQYVCNTLEDPTGCGGFGMITHILLIYWWQYRQQRWDKTVDISLFQV